MCENPIKIINVKGPCRRRMDEIEESFENKSIKQWGLSKSCF